MRCWNRVVVNNILLVAVIYKWWCERNIRDFEVILGILIFIDINI